jgi:2-phosphosulfolactate phosphatase
VAQATVRRLLRRASARVTFVLTGLGPGSDGDEDAACADYLEALLRGQQPDLAPYLERVAASPHGRRFADPAQPDFPPADLKACLQANRFDFAMRAKREAGQWRLEAVGDMT